jgi:hypothetical protein
MMDDVLLQAAERLIAVVAHEGGGPPPAGVVIPFQEWNEFRKLVAGMKAAHVPVESSEELTPPHAEQEGDEEETVEDPDLPDDHPQKRVTRKKRGKHYR